jgi:SAM-dependent methyltransferase
MIAARSRFATQAGRDPQPRGVRLHCPFCGSPLDAVRSEIDAQGLEYGVLACHCGRYPLVAGIPVLAKGPIHPSQCAPGDIIRMIEAGRHRDALVALLSRADTVASMAPLPGLSMVPGLGRLRRFAQRRARARRRRRAEELLIDGARRITAWEVFDFYFRQPGAGRADAFDYFAYRFGQPRHLATLALAALIREPKGPVLDLACGFGHIMHTLIRRAGGQFVVGVDRSFFVLYAAKTWLAPEGSYVCCDADRALPFADGTFAAAVCADAFHDFAYKTTCIRELRRVVGTGGVIMLAGLRNRHLHPSHKGHCLPPEGYQGLLAGVPGRLVSQRAILDRYLAGEGPPLGRSADLSTLGREPWFSAVLSDRESLFQDHGPLGAWPHAEGRLRLNPLYVEEGRAGEETARFRLTFPSAEFERDHPEIKEYLPETVGIGAETLQALSRGERTREVEALIRACVVVGVPERYASPQ